MRELRPHLTEERYMSVLGEMGAEGYRMFALRIAGNPVALAGARIASNLYYGRYLWVYDLVTTDSQRSRGHGQRLLGHLEELARAEGCDMIALSSGLQRANAHRFYERRMGYARLSFVFGKSLSADG
jgi:GNAT superfamily N-acetyltransferase